MIIDIATGLPELPEGFFWRVKANSWIEWYMLELRRKTWFGSIRITNRHIEPTRVELSPRHIQREAGWLIGTEKAKIGLGLIEKPASLLGDYPPKKLEVSE